MNTLLAYWAGLSYLYAPHMPTKMIVKKKKLITAQKTNLQVSVRRNIPGVRDKNVRLPGAAGTNPSTRVVNFCTRQTKNPKPILGFELRPLS